MYDLLIKNGTIVDGTGAPRFKGDVAVENGLIAKIAPVICEPAKRILDAKGLIVSPCSRSTSSHVSASASDFLIPVQSRKNGKSPKGASVEAIMISISLSVGAMRFPRFSPLGSRMDMTGLKLA